MTGTTGGAGSPGAAGAVPTPGAAAPTRAGDVVAGVRLTALVGAGATGEVWAGTQLSDGARVAVKLLRGAGAAASGGAGAVEGRLLSGLRHPHVLAVRRVSDDPPAVVTDLAEGGSLADQVAARGCLGAGELVTVLAPIADTLAFLHGRGVVHGDVTAANVLFVERGRPVLADLGGARLAGTGEVVATPGYAAPEVRAGAPATPAADVHGLGAVAWFALTGTAPPEPAEDRLPLRLLAPDCPDALVDAVVQALDQDPVLRPEPAELAAAVRAAAVAEAVRLVPAAARGVRADEAITYRVRQAARLDEPTRPERRVPARVRSWCASWLAAPRSHRRPGPHPDGRSDRGSRGSRGRWRPAVAAVAVAAALLSGTAWLLAVGSDADPVLDVDRAQSEQRPRQPAGQVAEQPVEQPPRGRTATSGGPADAAAREADVVEAARLLVDAREAALRSGDVAALLQVHHPDGDTLDVDRDALEQGPVPVRYDVLDVAAVPGEPGAVDVTLATLVTPGAGTEVERVRLHLQQHDGRWLLRDVSEVASS